MPACWLILHQSAAVIGMTKVQGKEYAETGVTINALAPAVIQTPLVDAMPAEQVKYMTDKIPMKRCGTWQEIADIVLFIVSPKIVLLQDLLLTCLVEELRTRLKIQPPEYGIKSEKQYGKQTYHH